MTETIYELKEGEYPFNRQKYPNCTYFQFSIKALTPEDVSTYTQINKILKTCDCPSVIKLLKIFKQEATFHLLYQYHPKSLTATLKNLESEDVLTEVFIQLEMVFDWLIKQGLKSELLIEFMAVDEKNHLKVWVRPDFTEKSEPEKKDQTQKILKEFYQTERTRLHLEIEELLQQNCSLHQHLKSTGEKQRASIEKTTTSKCPNFKISGNTLIFQSAEGSKKEVPKISQSKDQTESAEQSKASKEGDQERLVSKVKQAQKVSQKMSSRCSSNQPDFSKMSIAEKVLYYKKHNTSSNSIASDKSGKAERDPKSGNVVIIKNPSESSSFRKEDQNVSKSSNNSKDLEHSTTKEQSGQEQTIYTQAHERSFNKGNQSYELKKLNVSQESSKDDLKQPISEAKEAVVQNNAASKDKFQVEELKKQSQKPQVSNKVLEAKEKARKILQRYGQKKQK